MPRRVEVRVQDNTSFDPSYEGFREEIYLPEDLQGYAELWRYIEAAKERDYHEWKALMRLWSAGDAYFNVMFLLRVGREAYNDYRDEPHFWHQSHIEFSREVQFNGDDALFIASRFFGKSTHITLGEPLRHVYLNPNFSTCIFSITRELAEDHAGSIQTELRDNVLLKDVWGDRFYFDPDQAKGIPFSVKDGMRTKRSSSRPEETFEARAFQTRLPTGMHYDLRIYDDVETEANVSSEVTMQQAEERYVSSQDLRSNIGKQRVLGTYYHPGGLLRKIDREFGRRLVLFPGEDVSEEGKLWGKEHPEEAGPLGGRPANGFTRDQLFGIWNDKGADRRILGRISYGRQIACDPLSGESTRLNTKLVRYYEDDPLEVAALCRIYVCVDTASGTMRDGEEVLGEDPNFCWVWGLHPSRTFWWLDGWKMRLLPSKRLKKIFDTVLYWNTVSEVAAVRIEQYGAGEQCQAQRRYNLQNNLWVPVHKCHDHTKGKREREFERWDTLLAEGVWFPKHGLWREDENGQGFDLVEQFMDDELTQFPKPLSDHGLDAGGLILEPVRPGSEVTELEWPSRKRDRFKDAPRQERYASTLGAGGVV